jgi:hypothetical protein
MKCDVCGETTFGQKVAERLADILAPESTEQPTGSRWSPEYDFEKLERSRTDRGIPRIGASASG